MSKQGKDKHIFSPCLMRLKRTFNDTVFFLVAIKRGSFRKIIGIYKKSYRRCASFDAKRTWGSRGPRGPEREKRKRFLLLVIIFLCRTLASSLVTRTKRVRWTRLAGVTTFMANSRKNDRPNKLLAHAIKKKHMVRGFRWRGETRIKKKKRKSGVAAPGKQGAGQRDIAVGASLVKLTSDITERAWKTSGT